MSWWYESSSVAYLLYTFALGLAMTNIAPVLPQLAETIGKEGDYFWLGGVIATRGFGYAVGSSMGHPWYQHNKPTPGMVGHGAVHMMLALSTLGAALFNLFIPSVNVPAVLILSVLCHGICVGCMDQGVDAHIKLTIAKFKDPGVTTAVAYGSFSGTYNVVWSIGAACSALLAVGSSAGGVPSTTGIHASFYCTSAFLVLLTLFPLCLYFHPRVCAPISTASQTSKDILFDRSHARVANFWQDGPFVMLSLSVFGLVPDAPPQRHHASLARSPSSAANQPPLTNDFSMQSMARRERTVLRMVCCIFMLLVGVEVSFAGFLLPYATSAIDGSSTSTARYLMAIFWAANALGRLATSSCRMAYPKQRGVVKYAGVKATTVLLTSVLAAAVIVSLLLLVADEDGGETGSDSAAAGMAYWWWAWIAALGFVLAAAFDSLMSVFNNHDLDCDILAQSLESRGMHRSSHILASVVASVASLIGSIIIPLVVGVVWSKGEYFTLALAILVYLSLLCAVRLGCRCGSCCAHTYPGVGPERMSSNADGSSGRGRSSRPTYTPAAFPPGV
jgi:hypothetical protein